MSQDPRTAAEARLQQIYDNLPAIQCQGKCHSQCSVILMEQLEWDRIKARLGYEPTAPAGCMVCPMLKRGKNTCRVYDVRPLICRLWGVVDDLRCPHGCELEPGHKLLTRAEAMVLLRDVRALSETVAPGAAPVGPAGRLE